MRTFIIIMIVVFAISCKKKAETYIGSTEFSVSILDSTGADLLDTLYANCYEWDSIRIYDLIDSTPVMYYYSNRGLQYGFGIYNDYSKYYRLSTSPDRFAYPEEVQNYTMYIAWSKEDWDTIICETSEPYEGVKYIDKIYYNGKLSWNGEKDTSNKYFIIVK